VIARKGLGGYNLDVAGSKRNSTTDAITIVIVIKRNFHRFLDLGKELLGEIINDVDMVLLLFVY
jgi:hypothetical protein